jgi:hypothetical protein
MNFEQLWQLYKSYKQRQELLQRSGSQQERQQNEINLHNVAQQLQAFPKDQVPPQYQNVLGDPVFGEQPPQPPLPGPGDPGYTPPGPGPVIHEPPPSPPPPAGTAPDPDYPDLTLPPNPTFDDIAKYERALRERKLEESRGRLGQLRGDLQTQYDENLQRFRDQGAQRRAELEQNLGRTAQEQFQRLNPLILEDLNRRGLLNSPDAVAKAQSEALRDIQLSNEETLRNFDDYQRQYEDLLGSQRLNELGEIDRASASSDLQFTQDALDSALNLRRSQLQQTLQEATAGREEALARDLAREQSKAQERSSLIGTGGSLLGTYLLTRGMGGGAAQGGAPAAGGLSGLFGGASSPLGRSLAARGGPAAAGQGFTPLTPGGLVGGAGLGLLGGSLGRQAFGGGNDLGGIAGGALGYAYGGPAGAGLGSFLGTGAQRLGESFYEQSKRRFGNTGASFIKPFADPVGSVKSITRGIKKVFCFDPTTIIEMKNGDEKPITQIRLGDKTKGGEVESIRVSNTDPGTRYMYRGVVVTGGHAVKEGGKWVRVKDSNDSVLLGDGGVVYSLVTSKHRIYIDGIEFSDEHETDQYEDLTISESLKELNKGLLEEVI